MLRSEVSKISFNQDAASLSIAHNLRSGGGGVKISMESFPLQHARETFLGSTIRYSVGAYAHCPGHLRPGSIRPTHFFGYRDRQPSAAPAGLGGGHPIDR